VTVFDIFEFDLLQREEGHGDETVFFEEGNALLGSVKAVHHH